MTTELLVVHIGQGGIQLGNSMWELFCMEHAISPDGTCLAEDQDIMMRTFFQELEDNKYCPRVIFVDSEPTVTEEIRTGAYRNLYHPDQIINGKEDSANNFARGSFVSGAKILKLFCEKMRRLVEQTNNLESFLVLNTVAGGCGSGVGTLLLQEILQDFPKVTRVQMPILSGYSLNTTTVEPYNTMLHLHSTMETVDLAFLFDNEALYDICSNRLFMTSPVYTDINRVLSLMISSITCSLRHEAMAHSTIKEIETNLVPYPRIHFPMVRHAPIEHKSRYAYSNCTIDQMTKDVFSKSHQSIRCDTNRGRYIAIIMNYRGIVNPREIAQAMSKQKAKLSNFVEWCPTGYKLMINAHCPVVIPDSNIAQSDKGVTMICNTTALKEVWVRINKRFDLMFEKRAFLHWYIEEGMEENEFGESRMDVQLLEEDYNEIGLHESEMDIVKLPRVSQSQDNISQDNASR